MKTPLTPGAEIIRDLALQIEKKAHRLHTRAGLYTRYPSSQRLANMKEAIEDLRGVLDELDQPRCRLCGCTQDEACEVPQTGEPCSWVKPDLCSACVPAPTTTQRTP